MKHLIITNGTVITDRLIPRGTVVALGDRIIYVGSEQEGKRILKVADENVFEVIDAKGNYIAPGLIDVHIHGSDGADVMDATPEAIGTMARFLVKYGIVGFLPSTVSADREETRLAVQNVVDYKSGGNEAEVLGIHLEGPYLNFEFKGAQYGPAIRQADLQELEQLYEILGGKLKLITMAPEMPGSKEAIAWLTKRGVTVSIGHSGASYEEASEAFTRGVSHVTHTYNGMRGLHHREPGVVGAVLSSQSVTAELIADLIHVHPGAIRVMLQAIGTERIVLVSDAMQATGLSDGEYILGNLTVIVKDGIARLIEGNLASSTLTLLKAVENMVTALGVSLPEAFRMASLNPAQAIGLKDRGWIREGNRADVIIVTPAFETRTTIIGGKIAYSKD